MVNLRFISRVYSILKQRFGLIYTKVYRLILFRIIRTKSRIDIVFIIKHLSQWKYDSIYRKFKTDNRSNTLVLLLPDLESTDWEEQYEKTYEFLEEKLYDVIRGFDLKKQEYINTNLSFDIVFFSRLPNGNDPAYIRKLLSKFSCYIPYSIFSDNNFEAQYRPVENRLMWRYYVPSDLHKKMAFEAAGLNNTVVSGYPKFDKYSKNNEFINNCWKQQSKPKKKIIWSPHWTVDIDINKPYFSNFISMASLMLQIVDKYSDLVQFAFKPHPNLKKQLYDRVDWGKNKTDAYYAIWENLHNCQLEEFDYEDLFMSSDALINDSVSFMSEYLYTKKPQTLVIRDSKVVDRHFNEFAKKVVSVLYVSKNIREIEKFIDNVVLDGNDILFDKRYKVFLETLNINSTIATDLIYDDIVSEFFKN